MNIPLALRALQYQFIRLHCQSPISKELGGSLAVGAPHSLQRAERLETQTALANKLIELAL